MTSCRRQSDLNGLQGCYYRQYNDMKGNWSKTTWMVRGEYDLSDDVLLYLSHGTGWKSGVLQDGMGFEDLDDGTGNLDFTRNNALLQEPEEVDSTELGVKTDFAGWQLSANLFYMDFTNMQVTGAVINPVTGESTLTNTNVGGATIQGVEFESSVALFDAAGRLDFTLAYLDATYDEFLGNESNFGDARGRIWNPCGLGVEPEAAPASATCLTLPATACRMLRNTRRHSSIRTPSSSAMARASCRASAPAISTTCSWAGRIAPIARLAP